LISRGTDIVCGCHLLRCSYDIHYFLWLNNEFFIILYNILKNCCARLLSNYNIRHTCNIYTRLETCIMSISRLSLWEKVTHRLLNLQFYWADVVGWCRTLDIMLRDRCCSASMVRAQIPLKEEQNLTAQNLILTLFGLICRRIYNM
jgi:hypothetical protein